MQFPDHIIYRGYSAPVRIEADVQDLEVIGTIPNELNGAYYRNSADPTYPPLLGKDIFLNGDGMVHMVRFDNGHADLKTRYVRTRKFELERKARRALFGAYRNSFTDSAEVAGEDNNTANTSMLWHHGKLYALKESGRPYELDPATLATLGERDFNGQLHSKTFTAHPKLDPRHWRMPSLRLQHRRRGQQRHRTADDLTARRHHAPRNSQSTLLLDGARLPGVQEPHRLRHLPHGLRLGTGSTR